MRKIAWFRWEEVCRSKKEGGLGIKNLQLFNTALQWVWRFMTERDNLWVRVIRSHHGSLTSLRGRIIGNHSGGMMGWWKKIISTVEGDDSGWFWEKLAMN